MKLPDLKVLWRDDLKLGMHGPDVAEWQALLLADGAALGPAGADGIFGKLTHNGTVAWQRTRGVPTFELGTVGKWTVRMIGEEPVPATWRQLTWPSVPYLEAVNWSRDIGPQNKLWGVVHCIERAEASTCADWCAKWFAGLIGEAPRVSAHACVDDDSIVQCVPWDRIAWHAAGANQFGVGIEHAGFARQTAAEWRDPYSIRMLHRSAWLMARLAETFHWPIEFVDAEGLRAQRPGITTHAEVTKAFGKTDHMDPGGAFPMEQYLRLVRLA